MKQLNSLNPVCTCGAELDGIIDSGTTLDWQEEQEREEGIFTCSVECPGCGKIWQVSYEVQNIPEFIINKITETNYFGYATLSEQGSE